MPLLTDFYRQVVDGHEASSNGRARQQAAIPYHPWASDAGAGGMNGYGG
jgi:hypothetical protein